MLGAFLACMHMGLPTGPLMDLTRPLPHRCSYKYQIEDKEQNIQWITATAPGSSLLLPRAPFLLFFLYPLPVP